MKILAKNMGQFQRIEVVVSVFPDEVKNGIDVAEEHSAGIYMLTLKHAANQIVTCGNIEKISVGEPKDKLVEWEVISYYEKNRYHFRGTYTANCPVMITNKEVRGK
jgi:hypothetical protein